jgi:uncharacterized phage infection (PIP) family protein YhgE
MTRSLAAFVVIPLMFLAGCGSSSTPSPTATPVPPTATPTAAATPSTTGTAVPSPAASVTPAATPTALATSVASGTQTIGNIPLWCSNFSNAQTELNSLNQQMKGNPSVATLVATLHKLHDLISADAAKATGSVKTDFTKLAAAADQYAKGISTLPASMQLTYLKSGVTAIGFDWQIIKDAANCGVIK